MSPSLACVVNDEEFLILDDDDTDFTQANTDTPKASDVQ